MIPPAQHQTLGHAGVFCYCGDSVRLVTRGRRAEPLLWWGHGSQAAAGSIWAYGECCALQGPLLGLWQWQRHAHQAKARTVIQAGDEAVWPLSLALQSTWWLCELHKFLSINSISNQVGQGQFPPTDREIVTRDGSRWPGKWGCARTGHLPG